MDAVTVFYFYYNELIIIIAQNNQIYYYLVVLQVKVQQWSHRTEMKMLGMNAFPSGDSRGELIHLPFLISGDCLRSLAPCLLLPSFKGSKGQPNISHIM